MTPRVQADPGLLENGVKTRKDARVLPIVERTANELSSCYHFRSMVHLCESEKHGSEKGAIAYSEARMTDRLGS